MRVADRSQFASPRWQNASFAIVRRIAARSISRSEVEYKNRGVGFPETSLPLKKKLDFSFDCRTVEGPKISESAPWPTNDWFVGRPGPGVFETSEPKLPRSNCAEQRNWSHSAVRQTAAIRLHVSSEERIVNVHFVQNLCQRCLQQNKLTLQINPIGNPV